MIVIKTQEKFKELLDNEDDSFCLYGCGYVAEKIMYTMKQMYGSMSKIEKIYVSKKNELQTEINGIRIEQYKPSSRKKNIIIATGKKNASEIAEFVKGDGHILYWIDPSILSENGIYEEVFKSVQPFVMHFLENKERETEAARESNVEIVYAWSCWWQGEEQAPDIVKMCFESHRRFLPQNVNYIIVTSDNYQQYIDVPDFIINKVSDGSITFTTFSDILREMLLYKYGGIWFDATVYLHNDFPKQYFELNLYTCKGEKYHFKSFSEWSLWCMGGKAGNIFYKFLYEAFFYYYTKHDKIKYYLTVDYFIAIAMKYLDGVEQDYNAIPYNNEKADVLADYLSQKYEVKLFETLINNCDLSKLSYKIYDGRYGEAFKGFDSQSIYCHLQKSFLEK